MDEMQMVRDLLDVPPAPASVRERVRERAFADVTREQARRIPIGLALTAAAAAVAVAIGVVHRTGPGEGTARGVLLAAADQSAKATAGSGRFWHTQVQSGTLVRVGTAKDPYVITQQRLQDQWVASDPRTPAWVVTRDGAARPMSRADESAWRRAGSPHRWHLNAQGVTTVPIEGDDLVTDSQAAYAVNDGDSEGRVLRLGNWWATVQDVRHLPADPEKLRAEIIAKSDGSTDLFDPETPKQPDALVFQVGAQLLLEAPATPKVRAATYRMLAALKAVRSLGRVRDPLGRTGAGVAMTEHRTDGATMERQLIVDPRTGLLLADQEIILKPGTDEAWTKPGWRWTYTARLEGGWTDAGPVLPKIDCAKDAAPPVCR